MKSIAIYYRVSTDKQELQSQKKSVVLWHRILEKVKCSLLTSLKNLFRSFESKKEKQKRQLVQCIWYGVPMYFKVSELTIC